MQAAEFDKFAEEYLALHEKNIAVSGEHPDYFARYKIDTVARRWAAEGRGSPAAVLDFGTGIGASIPWLANSFPNARRVGLDVSEKSLAIAERRFPGQSELVRYEGTNVPFEPGSFDLVFSACVFHHIEHGEHGRLMADLKRLLKPGGVLAIFEHNPLNPLTRHIVATCPFDENAVLVGAGQLKKSQKAAGFRKVDAQYTAFFPAALKALRPLEPALGWVPVGGQYYTWAHD
jgi:ubiquinone/menaquinone biosynthesis C-methylase UbiE